MSELPQEQAFEKVIQTLLKSNLDEKNTVDSPQKDPMDSSSQQQFYSKVKFCILYLNSQIQEIKDRMSKMSPSLSPKENAYSNKNECDKSLMAVENNMILSESFFGKSLDEKMIRIRMNIKLKVMVEKIKV